MLTIDLTDHVYFLFHRDISKLKKLQRNVRDVELRDTLSDQQPDASSLPLVKLDLDQDESKARKGLTTHILKWLAKRYVFSYQDFVSFGSFEWLIQR